LVKAFYFGKSILFWLKKKSTPFSPFRVRISTPFHWYTKKVHPSTPFSLAPNKTNHLQMNTHDNPSPDGNNEI